MTSWKWYKMRKSLFIRRCLSSLNINEVEAVDGGLKTCAPHVPVMAKEAVKNLDLSKGQTILDMTFGAGGHSKKILETVPDIKLITLDRDPVAYSYSQELADKYKGQITPLMGKFSDLPKLLASQKIGQNSLDGMLFDFGCSSMQFDEAQRGFSVSKDGPLDMRMSSNVDPNVPTAADVLINATEEDLYKIIKYYGEEKNARKIAKAIVDSRYIFKKITTTQDLCEIIASTFPEEYKTDKLHRPSHVATKTFQALRIFVNNELNEINYGMILASKYLKIGGRLVTITFHSLEDTIVKRHMMGNLISDAANPLPLKYSSHFFTVDQGVIMEAVESNWKMLHKHVIVPRAEEVEDNPRSRSAKLRAAIRVK